MNEGARIAYKFFVFAALMLLVQVIVGLVAASQYLWPTFLFNLLPFNIIRMLHINALVIWLLAGFMGGSFYFLSQLSPTGLYSNRLANFNFWLLVVAVALVVLGYLYMGLSKNFSFLFSEGREYIEAPRWADWVIVVIALLFVFNVMVTINRGTGWNAITGVLMGGVAGLTVAYLFGMKFFASMSLDMYFWWWVVHLWVEGTWELVAGVLYALLLITLYGYPLEKAAKYLYLEVGLVLFTGILGTGHHYYWIGTPQYWLLLGGFFSALEPLPLAVMVYDAWKVHRKEKTVEHPNRVAQLWLLGGVLMHLFGAGAWGFLQTLPIVNRWTHGTQITAAHGHMAFYGAYAMLVIAVIYYALPKIKLGTDNFRQFKGMVSFWTMVIGNIGMVLALTVAGAFQALAERMGGIPYLEAQAFLYLPYMVRLGFGVIFFAGVLFFLVDVLSPRAETARP